MMILGVLCVLCNCSDYGKGRWRRYSNGKDKPHATGKGDGTQQGGDSLKLRAARFLIRKALLLNVPMAGGIMHQ